MISAQQAVSLRREAEAVQEEWERGAEPDARAALDRHPEWRADKSIALDLAYDEYCLRCEAGRPPEPKAFCDRFPSIRASLERLIGAHQFAAERADLLITAPLVRWPEPGERVGDLTFLRELGRGAFARVYLAAEESTGGRPVAVKLSPEGAAEARTMGRLAHPNIVPVLSARFESGLGLTLVCMPFLGAATLTDVLDQAYPTSDAPAPRTAAVVGEALRAAARADDPPPLASGAAGPAADGPYTDAVARLALQIADALAFLHKEGVIHQDLKPSNVLLRPDGQAVLLDFNLSADARAAGPRLGGTLPYMAPEQLRALLDGDRGDALDGRVDLFALGVMLYELLTGRHPFGAPPAGLPPKQAALALLERQRRGCVPLRTLNRAVDRRLARLVEDCLAFDPRRRPASAAGLAAGLRQYLSLPARLLRWAARRPVVAAGMVGLALLAAGGAASQAAGQPPAHAVEYDQGRTAYLAGDYDRAKALFNQAIQDYPKELKPRKYCLARAAALVRQAEAARDNSQAREPFTDAVNDLTEALRQQPDGPTLALMGYCNSQLGNHDAAILWYDKAEEAGFKSAGLCNDRGYSRLQRSMLDKARDDLDAALQYDAKPQAAFYNRALATLRMRPPVNPPPLDPVLSDVQAAVDAGPGSQELYLAAAHCFASAAREDLPADPKGRAGQALFYLQKAVECGVDPKQIAADPEYAMVLKPFEEFKTLLQTPKRPDGPTKVTRLVDPAPYLPD